MKMIWYTFVCLALYASVYAENLISVMNVCMNDCVCLCVNMAKARYISVDIEASVWCRTIFLFVCLCTTYIGWHCTLGLSCCVFTSVCVSEYFLARHASHFCLFYSGLNAADLIIVCVYTDMYVKKCMQYGVQLYVYVNVNGFVWMCEFCLSVFVYVYVGWMYWVFVYRITNTLCT